MWYTTVVSTYIFAALFIHVFVCVRFCKLLNMNVQLMIHRIRNLLEYIWLWMWTNFTQYEIVITGLIIILNSYMTKNYIKLKVFLVFVFIRGAGYILLFAIMELISFFFLFSEKERIEKKKQAALCTFTLFSFILCETTHTI